MAEQLLDTSQVRPTLQQMRGKTMTQGVDLRLDIGKSCVHHEPLVDGLTGKLATSSPDKESFDRAFGSDQRGANLLQVCLQERVSDLTHGQNPQFSPLAEHPEVPALVVTDLKVAGFADSQAA